MKKRNTKTENATTTDWFYVGVEKGNKYTFLRAKD